MGRKRVMRAALLLCALLAAPAVAPIGSSRGCTKECPPTQPKGCCTLSDGTTPWMYPGCTEKCNPVPNYREDGTCKPCPFGSYINSMQQTNTFLSSAKVKVTNGYGGKEICASPPSCPAGTYFPVDKFGLYTGFSKSVTTAGVTTKYYSFRTTTPCVKCGASLPGPTQSISPGATDVLYQPDAGAKGQGCHTCPDGKFVDPNSCKNKDGADLACSDALAVTGPTRCKDCTGDEVTMQGANGGCISKTTCEGSHLGATGRMADGKVCKPICPKNQWLQTMFCPSADSNGLNGKCDSSMCRDPAAGTRLPDQVAPVTFKTECDQKFNQEITTDSRTNKDSTCKSIVYDDATAKTASVGTVVDFTPPAPNTGDAEAVTTDMPNSYISITTTNYKQTYQYARSKKVATMRAYWCTSPGYANTDSTDPTKCTQCPPNTYSAGGFVTPTGYEETSGNVRLKFPTGLEPPSCSACPEGKFSSYGAAECTEDCPPGSALSDGKCTICEVGKFSPVANSKECTACAEGKFSGAPYDKYMSDPTYGPGTNFQQSLNVSGATRCGNCYHVNPASGFGFNGYRQVTISKGVANCTLCPAGKFLFNGFPAGKQNGRQAYMDKAVFSWISGTSSTLGAFRPLKVWRDSFFNEASDPSMFPAAKCVQCPPGSFSNTTTMLSGQTSPQCFMCPGNSVPNRAQDGCKQCPPGTRPGPVGFIYTPLADN